MRRPDHPLRRRVWVEVDLGRLARNYNRIAEAVRPAKVMCVLKANAYGLGVAAYAKTLMEAGCRHFGVAEPFEALELRRIFGKAKGAPSVQILSSVLPDEIPAMVEAGVTLPVADMHTACLIADAGRGRKAPRIHFKLDTGMGRLGILATGEGGVRHAVDRMTAIWSKCGSALDYEGVFSHFPMAFDPDDPFTKGQIALFRSVLERLPVPVREVHIAASDGINNFPECARPPFTMVRTGINLHGSFDPNGRRAMNVEPVLSLKTRVAQVRSLPAGTTLGYGRTWCLNRETRVATISAGYADGLPLALSNRGFVLIGGRRCRIIGRISMDYATVDVSDVPGVEAGDEVVCFGSCGEDSITPDDWAALKGTHAYDIICSLGSRVERRYV